MSSVSALSKLIAPAVLAAAFLFSIALSPGHAAAQTTTSSPGSVETSELLPPGQNVCPAVSIINIEPHVYGGVLESFDVTISDTSNSYVGIIAQIDGTPVPLNYITRWAGKPSGLMIHVDTPEIVVAGNTPVSLTLLSSPSGTPTCMTSISFNVGAPGLHAAAQTNGYSQPNYPTTPATNPAQTSAAPASVHSSSSDNTPTPVVATSSTQGTSGTSLVGASIASASSANFFNAVCSGSNAYRLWFILLVIYVIIVAIVVFAEPWFLENSVIGSTAAILIPLILLLAFWYLSASCRAASWIPVVACVIAIVGLFLAFREYELPPLLPAPSEQ